MNIHERLTEAVRGLPDGAAVMLPVSAVRDWLADEPAGADGPLCDLTVEDVARELDRSTSTVRTWLAAGKVQGAYRLQGREWRVPRSALRQFLNEQGSTAQAHPGLDDRVADLGAWRKERTV